MANTSLKRLLPYLILCLAAIAIAAWLRIHSAQTRQFHADEGVQAYQAWRLASEGEYEYNPQEHHGPSLYFLAKWLWPALAGEDGRVTDFSVRMLPLVFGLGTIALLLACFPELGWRVAMLGALFASIAPLQVIYHAYFVQESMLAFFTLLALLAGWKYLRRPSALRGIGFGLSLGAMHVTKETAIVHAFCLVAALLAYLVANKASRSPTLRQVAAHGSLALLGIAILHLLFFSSFGRNWSGVPDGLTAYFNYTERAEGQGHEKPLFHYLSLFLPHVREGIRWSESLFLAAMALGLIGIGSQPRRFAQQRGLTFVFTVFGMGCLLVYSFIPYKTPWLMLTPFAALSVTAASGLIDTAKRFKFNGKWRMVPPAVAVVLAVLVIWQLAAANRKAVFTYPSASRNPYLYQHTAPRYELLTDRLKELTESLDRAATIGVYSPDFAWPLPWHLRHQPKVGYWSSLDDFEPHDIDVIDTRLLGERAFASSPEVLWELYGLRPNVLLSLRVQLDRFPAEIAP